ncbi:AAA-like domain-containing protein [Ohtaekwangia koreensis]|uniref:AAA-like domain-containing protein n=1 Tax=Ohtaekwangia koreensis TaxID=688867 RepID=A0A1T5KQ16_9BACT|nr:AAA-like domain-containing protein [Ohtaekwangia koreensis]SKC65750.1 AAA-like domain-containing protein [Ohtaekwangia koreensis]
MKEKKLYNNAIIPDDLYVHRDADRKLREIILRMSKPAYVSVARQMGKTNLLIQTKRALENENSRYVYIDITNKFESAQDCFRYIINQILNANESIKEFQEAAQVILAKRKNNSASPTEEYQNEMREILKRYPGTIVVFLDEVDDLRKHSFSDDIFGQIRKNYFINETYPVLKRVTYVLSGVIDPEKLIKTKENSPFNIAIPIYLDDFTFEQFLEFVSKSGLELGSDIKEYIYDWLRGNPRMTFEILSLIEDEQLQGELITKGTVDKAITDFYLTNFKNPPIDHIRDLIKHNTEVRKALIKLKKGESLELSDDVINKFYLFGITSTKIDKKNLRIKNRVIEESLSDAWLNSIELEKKGYYDYGCERIKQGDYEGGIKILLEFLQNEPKGNFANLAKYEIGIAYYELGNHEFSNQYLLEKPISMDLSPESYFTQINYIGANFIKLGKRQVASKYFDEIIHNSHNPSAVINAYVNKGECLLNDEENYNAENTEFTYLQALNYVSEHKEEIPTRNSLLALINYRLGYIYRLENKPLAAEKFREALQFVEIHAKPTIILFIITCEDSSEIKKSLFKEVTDLIIESEIAFKETTLTIPLFSEIQLALILSNLVELELEDDFQRLLHYALNDLYSGAIEEYRLLFKVAETSLTSKNLKAAQWLYKRVITFDGIDPQIERKSALIAGLVESSHNSQASISYLLRYIKVFNEFDNFHESLTLIDFDAFIRVIDYFRAAKKYDDAFNTALIIEKHFSTGLSSEGKADSVVILFYIMDYYAYSGNVDSSVQYGNKILSLISEVKPSLNSLSYVDRRGLDNIQKQTRGLMNSLRTVRQIEPIKLGKREPGRNEYVKVRYKNGSEIVTKYKKVMDEISKGECIIIE